MLESMQNKIAQLEALLAGEKHARVAAEENVQGLYWRVIRDLRANKYSAFACMVHKCVSGLRFRQNGFEYCYFWG